MKVVKQVRKAWRASMRGQESIHIKGTVHILGYLIFSRGSLLIKLLHSSIITNSLLIYFIIVFMYLLSFSLIFPPPLLLSSMHQ